jgi:hypothetical protein
MPRNNSFTSNPLTKNNPDISTEKNTQPQLPHFKIIKKKQSFNFSLQNKYTKKL